MKINVQDDSDDTDDNSAQDLTVIGKQDGKCFFYYFFGEIIQYFIN